VVRKSSPDRSRLPHPSGKPLHAERMGIWISVSMSSWLPPSAAPAPREDLPGLPAASYRFSGASLPPFHRCTGSTRRDPMMKDATSAPGRSTIRRPVFPCPDPRSGEENWYSERNDRDPDLAVAHADGRLAEHQPTLHRLVVQPPEGGIDVQSDRSPRIPIALMAGTVLSSWKGVMPVSPLVGLQIR